MKRLHKFSPAADVMECLLYTLRCSYERDTGELPDGDQLIYDDENDQCISFDDVDEIIDQLRDIDV